MKIHKLFLYHFFVTLYSTSVLASTNFIFSTDVQLTGLKTKQVKSISANDKAELVIEEPMLIESKGRIPLLMIPSKDQSEIKIEPPLVQDVFNKNVQEEASAMLSPLLLNFTQIQKLIQNKNYKEAQSQLQKLRIRFPNVDFLDFIEASLLALNGNRNLAIEILEKALKNHPDYEDGKVFLKKLKGER